MNKFTTENQKALQKSDIYVALAFLKTIASGTRVFDEEGPPGAIAPVLTFIEGNGRVSWPVAARVLFYGWADRDGGEWKLTPEGEGFLMSVQKCVEVVTYSELWS